MNIVFSSFLSDVDIYGGVGSSLGKFHLETTGLSIIAVSLRINGEALCFVFVPPCDAL
jgi:hypothetical protein